MLRNSEIRCGGAQALSMGPHLRSGSRISSWPANPGSAVAPLGTAGRPRWCRWIPSCLVGPIRERPTCSCTMARTRIASAYSSTGAAETSGAFLKSTRTLSCACRACWPYLRRATRFDEIRQNVTIARGFQLRTVDSHRRGIHRACVAGISEEHAVWNGIVAHVQRLSGRRGQNGSAQRPGRS
jgi:hypothetical protein